jgi:hypothetical protein
MRLRDLWSTIGLGAAVFAAVLPAASAQQMQSSPGSGGNGMNMTPWRPMSSPDADISPLPNYKGDFVSVGGDGAWNTPVTERKMLGAAALSPEPPAADCSRVAIVHYAKEAPGAFEAGNGGRLYGVQTHTPETRITTRYWDMPGANSCALVVYAILKKAGCGWVRYTADAKAIYNQAYAAGWKPSETQEGGCMVAWNSRSDGPRSRIGDVQKQARSGTTLYRHVGIATGSWLSVDNTSWLGRPTRFFTFRPIIYESPIFLCPPADTARQERRRKG